MKRALLINLFLAFTWAGITGDLSSFNILLGFIIGSAVLLASHPLTGSADYFNKIRFAVELFIVFLWELVKSSFQIAFIIIRPRFRMNSGIIALPLDLTTDAAINLLANLISLTPGTLSLQVSEDRQTLFIHAMNINEQQVESRRQTIKHTLERRIQQIHAKE